jgi:hypothetical protein
MNKEIIQWELNPQEVKEREVARYAMGIKVIGQLALDLQAEPETF